MTIIFSSQILRIPNEWVAQSVSAQVPGASLRQSVTVIPFPVHTAPALKIQSLTWSFPLSHENGVKCLTLSVKPLGRLLRRLRWIIAVTEVRLEPEPVFCLETDLMPFVNIIFSV